MGLFYNDGSTLTNTACISFERGSGAPDGAMAFVTNQSERLRIASDGHVRIQKTLANARLLISRNESVGTDNTEIGVIDFGNNTQHTVNARIMAKTSGTGNVGGQLVVETRDPSDSTLTEKLRIASDGKLTIKNATGSDYAHTEMGWAQRRHFSVAIINNETRWYKIVDYAAGNMIVGKLEIYSSRGGGFNQTKGYNEWKISYVGYNNDIYGQGAEDSNFQANYGASVDIHTAGSPKNVWIKVPGSIYSGRVYMVFEGMLSNWQFDEDTYVTTEPS